MEVHCIRDRQHCHSNELSTKDLLMIWERISTHSSTKDFRRVRVLLDWAEVEYPVVVPVAMVEKFLRIFASVAVQAFYAICGISHNYDTVCNVCQICTSEVQRR